jgi:hypothetical protein
MVRAMDRLLILEAENAEARAVLLNVLEGAFETGICSTTMPRTAVTKWEPSGKQL